MTIRGTFFNTSYYLAQNADVNTRWFGSALDHFIRFGASENRAPNSWFVAAQYSRAYTDLQAMSAAQLYEHYETFGYREGRAPSSTYANFSAQTYLNTYTDLTPAGINALTALNHYLNFGVNESRVATNIDGSTISSGISGSTYTLTIGADSGAAFTGTANNDTFTAADTTATTWTVGDAIDGGAGTDTFTVIRTAAITKPTGATVANIETANMTSGATVTLDTTSGFTGLTTLNTTGVAGATITAASTTAISVTDSALAAGAIVVNGGSTATVNATGHTTGTITLGATTAAAGAVSVTTAGVFADGANNTVGAIAVTGGTTVGVTVNTGITAAQIAAQNLDATNFTETLSAVTITGNASTIAATVTQGAAVVEVDSATIGKIGVVNGAVTIADVNAASATAAGKLATVTLNNYGDSTINSGALTTVNLSGTGGTLGITTGALTTPAVTTLALNVNGLSYKNAGSNNAITVDADITTLNIGSSTAASTVNNITATGATTVNVSGDAVLTLTTNTFAAATAINVTNTAGASFGTTAVGAAVTFTGGAGADTMIMTTGFTKANTMGAGNDTVTYAGAAGTGGSMNAGDGTDKIIMTFAQADAADASSVFNSKFTGFETLQFSDAITGAIDLDGINAATKVIFDLGSNAGTINNIVSGGTVQTNANNAGATAINVKSALVGATDVLNYSMNKNGVLAAGSVTVANVETINILNADAVTTGSDAAIDTLTLVATSATSVTVVGNNGLTLTNTGNTAITNFDASGVVANSTAATTSVAATTDSAANLAVTFSSANVTASANVSIAGGAGNDVLVGSVAKDTISGNAGVDYIYGDNAGTKEVQTVTITYTASETDVVTINGVAVSFATGANQNAATAALTAAVNAQAELKGVVAAVDTGGGVVTMTWLVDGDQIISVDTTSAANTNAVAEVTPGVAGTTAIDTLSGGAGADVLVGGGGADTITTGTGADKVFMMKAHSVLATMATITDHTYAVGGSSNDTILLGDVATVIGTTTTVQDLSAQTTLAAAMDAAALTNVINNGLSVFIWGGNEYAFVETTGATATYQATDFVVKLTGTPLAAGATIAGAGFDAV